MDTGTGTGMGMGMGMGMGTGIGEAAMGEAVVGVGTATGPGAGQGAAPDPESDAGSGGGWDRVGVVRRARRVVGLSQRAMAARAGLAKSTVARAESGEGAVSLEAVAAILDVAGLHLAVVDAAGRVVTPMRAHTVRDRAGRYFPAHLDTVPPAWCTPAGHQWHYDRPMPQATFARGGVGAPVPGPGAPGRPQDHVTGEELVVLGRQALEALRARFPRPATPALEVDCACGPECELDCVPDCPCQCEPPGFPLTPVDTHRGPRPTHDNPAPAAAPAGRDPHDTAHADTDGADPGRAGPGRAGQGRVHAPEGGPGTPPVDDTPQEAAPAPAHSPVPAAAEESTPTTVASMSDPGAPGDLRGGALPGGCAPGDCASAPI